MKLWRKRKSNEPYLPPLSQAAEDAVFAVDREENASTAIRVYDGGAAAALSPSGRGQVREQPVVVNPRFPGRLVTGGP